MEMMGLDSDVLEQLYKLCSTRLCSNTLGQVHRRIGRDWKGDGRRKERDGGGSYKSAWWGEGEECLISHCAWLLATARPVIHRLQYLSTIAFRYTFTEGEGLGGFITCSGIGYTSGGQCLTKDLSLTFVVMPV